MSEKILTFLERVEMNLPVQSQEVFDQAVGGAAVLCGDGHGVHPEYIRGVAEMIMMFMGWSGDEVAGIINAIHEKAHQL
jgi:hypothetical protein